MRQCIPCHCVNIFLSSLELLIGDNLDIPPRHAVALKGAASRTKAADAACPSSPRQRALPRLAEGICSTAHATTPTIAVV